MAIWAQLIDPIALQPANVELATCNESVKRFAAAPPRTVEQFWNVEPDTLTDCSTPSDPTAYSAPLVSFTDRLRNVHDEAVTDDALTCTMPSSLRMSEKVE